MNNTLKISFLFILFSTISFANAQNTDLVGKTTSQEIRSEHPIFDIYTKRYSPDSTSIKYLSQLTDSIKIYVLFGTWCHDSKKQVPAFMKILEVANNDVIEAEYIALTREKSDAEGFAKLWQLKFTPTFIIYRNGIEYGRIIEEPSKKMELDLVEILKSEAASD